MFNIFVLEKDWFLKNLPDDSKVAVSRYVRDEGKPVPEEFEGFDDALSSGKPFIIRACDPSQYGGISGLLTSPKITPEDIGRVKEGARGVRAKFFKVLKQRLDGASDQEFENGLRDLDKSRIRQYCRFLGIDEADFRESITYSYWELLGGLNRTVIADSCIEDRHHIFTVDTAGFGAGESYVCVENGQIVVNEGYGTCKPGSVLDHERLIGFYEDVRTFPKFDPRHCPVLEIQTAQDEDNFLQYHRGRDFSPPTFEITRDPQRGEVEATFVRGCTPTDDFVCHMTWLHDYQPELVNYEPGFLDTTKAAEFFWLYNQLMFRRRLVQVADSRGWTSFTRSQSVHLPASMLSKPGVTIVVPKGSIEIPEAYMNRVADRVFEEGGTATLSFRVIADGRRALLKCLDYLG